MGFDVKKTTKWNLMDWLCPHRCRGCGQLGEPLCKCCKNNILASNLKFRRKYSKAWCVGKREGLLGEIIKEYKYESVRALSDELAELLAMIMLERLERAEGIVIVPLPTIAKHIRQRGFDHMWLIGRKLAKMGGWRCERVLMRANNTVQVGQDKKTRMEQAKTAYRVIGQLDDRKCYILIDDVLTTGASMQAAEAELRRAGIKKIEKLVIAISDDN